MSRDDLRDSRRIAIASENCAADKQDTTSRNDECVVVDGDSSALSYGIRVDGQNLHHTKLAKK